MAHSYAPVLHGYASKCATGKTFGGDARRLQVTGQSLSENPAHSYSRTACRDKRLRRPLLPFLSFGDKSACTNGGWTVHYRAFGCFPGEQSGNLDVAGGGSTNSCGRIVDHVQGLRNRNNDRGA